VHEVERAKAHLEVVLRLDPGNADASVIVKQLTGGTTMVHLLRGKKSAEAKLLARERRGSGRVAKVIVGLLVLAGLGAGGWFGWQYAKANGLVDAAMKEIASVISTAPAPTPVPSPPPEPSPEPPDPVDTVASEDTIVAATPSTARKPATASKPRPKPASKPRHATAKVRVRLIPSDARLSVDGKAARVEDGEFETVLSAGRHSLKATAQGHEEFTKIYEVSAGASQVIDIVLREAEKTGTLHVHSYPWAELFVDGRYRGNTPISVPLELDVGRHSVVLSRNGYQQVEQMVEIQPGKLERIKVTLTVQ
jgi:outer membrane biosynthesis protein TonB